jgi:4-alpha-glucanotransferase
MVVLQFAWGGGTNNVHLPHMHYENSFCYPGTHDNETAVGWFAGSANAQVGLVLPASQLLDLRQCIAHCPVDGPAKEPCSLPVVEVLWYFVSDAKYHVVVNCMLPACRTRST